MNVRKCFIAINLYNCAIWVLSLLNKQSQSK